jgi:hypothetical protein
MDVQHGGDALHRTVKLALDTGEASNIEEAERLFAGYSLLLEVGPDIARSPTLQAALLTAVNTSRRCFLGGVQVVGKLDVTLRVPWRHCRTLAEAIVALQGKIVAAPDPSLPRIIFGDVENTIRNSSFAVRATFDGWTGGVIPLEDTHRLAEQQEFTPSGVLAGAISVSEAFQFVRGSNVQAGRRAICLSLWRPEEETTWQRPSNAGPSLEILPSRLWLIGLGHLGQAYLWTLGLLPYADPKDVQLVLQDFDALVPANDSTSLLTTHTLLSEKKTRAIAHWCEERGFQAAIYERRFRDNFRVDGDEPSIALCGIDNALGRSALEGVGFHRVIEAGLGWGTEEYLAFQVHTFPALRSARERWGGVAEGNAAEKLLSSPAYQSLAAAGLDQCGLAMLAGRSVGASFVGAATAAIVIAELLRMVMGEHRYEVIDGTLRSLKSRKAIQHEGPNAPFNHGYTMALAQPEK